MNKTIGYFLKRLSLSLLGCALFFAAAEGLLRAVGFGYPSTFLIPARIGGRRVLVDNQFYGYRFFPPRMARAPAPIVTDPGSGQEILRIAVLGESAAMGEPNPDYGMPRMVQRRLERRCPGTRTEAINAAMTAIDSHVLREIAGDLARIRPRVFVLYVGNNEVVGPYGPASVLTPFVHHPALARLRVVLTRLRISQVLRPVATLFMPRAAADSSWGGMEMFEANRISADDPRMETVYAAFERNLAAMVESALACGAGVVLCTVAVNIENCPPLASLHDPALTAEATAEWQELFDQGHAVEDRGDYAGALELYRKAEALDNRPAELAFHIATCLNRSGQPEAARTAYEQARDFDALRFRADSRINRIIREEAARHGPRVRLVDAAALCGAGRDADLFLDHVHFTLAGNHRLAEMIEEAVAQVAGLSCGGDQSALSLGEMATNLFFNPWAEFAIADRMLERYRRPPFSTRPDHQNNAQIWAEHMREAAQRIKQTQEEALRGWAEDLERTYPSDWAYPLEWGTALYNLGRYQASELALVRALELIPHRYEVRGQLAMVLGFQGRSQEGIHAILGQDRKHGHYALEMLRYAGRTLMANGRAEAALPFFEAAYESAPGEEDVLLNLAACCARLGDKDRAAQLMQTVKQRRQKRRLKTLGPKSTHKEGLDGPRPKSASPETAHHRFASS